MVRRVGSVLGWAVVLVLGAFGIFFSFANYPFFAIGLVVLLLLLTGYVERTRRAERRAREAARRADKARQEV